MRLRVMHMTTKPGYDAIVASGSIAAKYPKPWWDVWLDGSPRCVWVSPVPLALMRCLLPIRLFNGKGSGSTYFVTFDADVTELRFPGGIKGLVPILFVLSLYANALTDQLRWGFSLAHALVAAFTYFWQVYLLAIVVGYALRLAQSKILVDRIDLSKRNPKFGIGRNYFLL